MKVTINWSYVEAGSCTVETDVPLDNLVDAKVSKKFKGDSGGMHIDEVCQTDKADNLDAKVISRDPFGELLAIVRK